MNITQYSLMVVLGSLFYISLVAQGFKWLWGISRSGTVYVLLGLFVIGITYLLTLWIKKLLGLNE